jgi:hypothetical protein
MRRFLFGLAVVAVLAAAGGFSSSVQACPYACCLPDNTCVEVETQQPCWDQGGTAFGGYCADLTCGGVPDACRMTGGGVDTYGNWNGVMANGADDPDRYTFGGQVGAPTASQPSPHGEWTHHQQSGPDGDFVFHAGTSSAPPETRIARVDCSDPGWCNPARQAPDKQIDYVGIGSFKNMKKPSAPLMGVIPGVTFHWFEAHVEDLGEPGRGGKTEPPASFCPADGSAGAIADCDCPDFYSITIHATSSPASAIIYHVHGYITGGNLQIHPPIQ